MDSISSNPYFNPAHLQNPHAAGKNQSAENASSHIKPESVRAVPQATQSEPFSSMFNDDELAKLQSNLEKIATQAERALKRFSSDS